MINSNWGDYGAETFKEFILYNYAWSAQCSWDYTQSDLSKFTKDYFYDFFNIGDERIPSIYNTLSDPMNQIIWHEVWRHPLLKFKEPVWWEPKISKAARISWNELTLPQIKLDVENLKTKVMKNADHFDLIEFILQLNDWYKLKLETQIHLQNIIEENAVGNESEITNLIDENINNLNSLKQNYINLWLKYYKDSNLNMVEDKFDRLISYFQEIKENLLSQNIFSFKPLLDSKWLYFKNEDSSFASKAEFTTSFEVNNKPDEAYLQLLGDTYVKLYINEKFVDKVYARRSLSLLVDYRRIKFIDIKPFLVNGKNTINIIAESFNKKNGAGFNLIASIKSGEHNSIIMSDDSKSSKVKWLGRKTEDNSWKEVVSKAYPFEIIAPNFRTKRTSWIER